jgi:diaminohydroxyphosphoribosylaminopyrimidine deaminase/5-amino-6-(5-phosphoribosylamino)uracil reductase
VIVAGGEVVGEGWHKKFGGPHAEVEALAVAGVRARGGTAFVTLEPCCHHGKTPPCTEALIQAGIARVVCAQRDPYVEVGGRGIAALEAAGIQVEVGLMEAEAKRLNAPYLKLVTTGTPWISGEASRAIVHQLRGRMDGVMVGRGTVEADDPLLTARLPGTKTATRIVVDSRATLSIESRLVISVGEAPVLLAVGAEAPQENIERLVAAGCEVIVCGSANIEHQSQSLLAAELAPRSDGRTHQPVSIPALLAELGRRRMTNVLVEGGGELLGSLFDAGAIDEVHVFIAPKLIGGAQAKLPIAGLGLEKVAAALPIGDLEVRHVGGDLYLRGRIANNA